MPVAAVVARLPVPVVVVVHAAAGLAARRLPVPVVSCLAQRRSVVAPYARLLQQPVEGLQGRQLHGGAGVAQARQHRLQRRRKGGQGEGVGAK